MICTRNEILYPIVNSGRCFVILYVVFQIQVVLLGLVHCPKLLQYSSNSSYSSDCVYPMFRNNELICNVTINVITKFSLKKKCFNKLITISVTDDILSVTDTANQYIETLFLRAATLVFSNLLFCPT